jgi:spermidine synthase
MALLLISPQLQISSAKRSFNFYVASNLGSLMGLILYPLLVEPHIGLTLQKNLLLVSTSLIFIWFIFKPLTLIKEHLVPITDRSKNQILLWSALGTILLGSFSFTLIQDIVSFPLLWVLPLSIYLGAFTWAFSRNPWGQEFIKTKAVTILEVISLILLTGIKFSAWVDIILNLLWFSGLMLVVQHYLAKSAPEDKAQLPAFYYLVGLGGLLGGCAVNLLVPLVFTKMNEYLFFILLTLGLILFQEQIHWRKILSAGVLGLLLVGTTIYKDSFLLDSGRSFYGIIRVAQQGSIVSMYHGQIVHGQEDQNHLGTPTTYYQPLQVGDLFTNPKPQRVLIIGLGAGVLLHYLDNTQWVDIIEIDPLVMQMAQKYFTFIDQNQSTQRFFLGDGRKELANLHQKYDLIILDAFSGDAIPLHLLTKEAFSLYREHLADSGTLALHLSNNYLNLGSVVQNTAKASEFIGSVVTIKENDVPATWGKFKKGKLQPTSGLVWSDDFSSLWSVIKWTW